MKYHLTLKELPPPDSRPPRERLIKQGGAESLATAELLAIILRTGYKGRTAIQVAEQLLSVGGVKAALCAIWLRLMLVSYLLFRV